jgi:hypothetical protein
MVRVETFRRQAERHCGLHQPYATLSQAMEAAADGELIEIHPGCPPEIAIVVEKDLAFRGSGLGPEGEPLVKLQVGTVVLNTFQPCEIEDLIIEGSPGGYLENLLHVDCLEARLTNVVLTGGGNGMLVTSHARVTGERLLVEKNNGHGITVENGWVTLRSQSRVSRNAMYGLTAAVIKKGQGESRIDLCDTTVEENGAAGLAAVFGGWIFAGEGCVIQGHDSSGIYVNGPRSICHVSRGVEVKRNDLGLLLAQRSCCHAHPESIFDETRGKEANRTRMEVFEGCEWVPDDGTEAAEQEQEYSRSVVMGKVSGRKSLVDMRNRACGVANVDTGPGGDCAVS